MSDLQTGKLSKIPQIFSGISFIWLGVFNFLDFVSDFLSLGIPYDISLSDRIMYLSVFFSLIAFIFTGIFIIVKKTNIAVTVGFGVIFIYPILHSCQNTLSFFGLTNSFYPLISISTFYSISIAILLIYSIIAQINPYMKILKMWFIPYTVVLIYYLLSVYTEYRYDNNASLYNIILTSLFSLGAMLYTIALAQDAKNPPETEADSNELYAGYNSTGIDNQATIFPYACAPSPDVTTELRKYKELLDEGIITEEEFNIKKSQLLNL